MITGNPNNGVLGFEYPNPFPPEEATIFFQLSGNKINNNILKDNGYNPGLEGIPLKAFNGDVSLLSNFAELFGGPEAARSTTASAATRSLTRPSPRTSKALGAVRTRPRRTQAGGEGAAEYILTLQGQIEFIRSLTPPVPQPAPGPQPSMPDPCAGVPKNPLCPKGNIG